MKGWAGRFETEKAGSASGDFRPSVDPGGRDDTPGSASVIADFAAINSVVAGNVDQTA